MACAKCGAAVADMFTPDGDVVCKPCFYADDIRRKESGLPKILINSGVAGIVVGTILLTFGVIAKVVAKAVVPLAAGFLTGGVVSLREGLRRRRVMREKQEKG